MDLSVIPYKHVVKSDNEKEDDDVVEEDDKTARRFDKDGEPVVMNPKATVKAVLKYRECMRNHAASMGGHASDGCGEFMPRGGGDPRESLTCAACGCHRNFHRREVRSPRLPPTTTMLFYNAGPTVAYDGYRRHHDGHDGCGGGDRRSETPERVGPRASAKRFRTKFTQEQKDKMLEFAERIGWRIQRHDDVALNQFCSEVGVKRNVLKVWMHNNKNAHRRREDAHQSPPQPPPPPQAVGV
ncbi:zinc-finger homeodomain protein 2-like isoform X1 [Corylus avellana]|uniref:zinc-finger homeodomain protein 2-like isoform X1 n=1 Tax=Corylus avellana TaxID=13451 RepID=UPI00286CF103|nr:zinc-finger homeodomain protein 2-like isoform X1 [Corylus avellana]